MKLYNQGRILLDQIKDTVVPKGFIAIWALGQEGFAVKTDQIMVMFDPYLSNWIYEKGGKNWVRKFQPPLNPEDCLDFDYVICSHHHGDHMDKLTLQAMKASNKTRFLVPKAHLHLLKDWGFADHQIIGMSNKETIHLEGMDIQAFAGKHEQYQCDAEGEHKFLGYVADFSGVRLYHAGDTVGFGELVNTLKEKAVDIAMIPINGKDYVRQERGIIGNCNYREAVEMAVGIGADMVIPMHFGLFPHNDENPAYFVDYLYTHHPYQKFHMFTTGERFIYMK